MDYSEISREFPKSSIFRFPDKFFISTQTYSQLMLQIEFYRTFFNYRTILITQLDSIVVNDIPDFVLNDFDYVGAAWEKPFWIFSLKRRLILTNHWVLRPISKKIWVGNGGLSIRNVDVTIEVLSKFYASKKTWDILELNLNLNEDVVLSYLMQKYKKKVPSLLESQSLFREFGSKYIVDCQDILGFHALASFNPSLEEKILSSNE